MNFKRILSYPYVFIKKIALILIQEFNELIFPHTKRLAKQKALYYLLGFIESREYYINNLNKVLLNLGFATYDELNGMYSEHLIIFSALSIHQKNIKNILEIGTYDGKTASILSYLFPSSKITTIDLKDDDPIFRGSYNREKDYTQFIRNRNLNIEKNSNINFIQINSLELSVMKDLPKQDLIWVDGAHGYPVIAADITNSIGLMKKNSILMCDDIWKNCKNNDDMYQSIAGFEVLKAYSTANLLETKFFRKRIGKKFNGNYKFVSFSKLL